MSRGRDLAPVTKPRHRRACVPYVRARVPPASLIRRRPSLRPGQDGQPARVRPRRSAQSPRTRLDAARRGDHGRGAARDGGRPRALEAGRWFAAQPGGDQPEPDGAGRSSGVRILDHLLPATTAGSAASGTTGAPAPLHYGWSLRSRARLPPAVATTASTRGHGALHQTASRIRTPACRWSAQGMVSRPRRSSMRCSFATSEPATTGVYLALMYIAALRRARRRGALHYRGARDRQEPARTGAHGNSLALRMILLRSPRSQLGPREPAAAVPEPSVRLAILARRRSALPRHAVQLAGQRCRRSCAWGGAVGGRGRSGRAVGPHPPDRAVAARPRSLRRHRRGGGGRRGLPRCRSGCSHAAL